MQRRLLQTQANSLGKYYYGVFLSTACSFPPQFWSKAKSVYTRQPTREPAYLHEQEEQEETTSRQRDESCHAERDANPFLLSDHDLLRGHTLCTRENYAYSSVALGLLSLSLSLLLSVSLSVSLYVSLSVYVYLCISLCLCLCISLSLSLFLLVWVCRLDAFLSQKV
jgi:hypothetical protein